MRIRTAQAISPDDDVYDASHDNPGPNCATVALRVRPGFFFFLPCCCRSCQAICVLFADLRGTCAHHTGHRSNSEGREVAEVELTGTRLVKTSVWQNCQSFLQTWDETFRGMDHGKAKDRQWNGVVPDCFEVLTTWPQPSVLRYIRSGPSTAPRLPMAGGASPWASPP